MNEESRAKVAQLRIDPADRRRSTGTVKLIFISVVVLAVIALLVWKPWAGEGQRTVNGKGGTLVATSTTGKTAAQNSIAAATTDSPTNSVRPTDDHVVLTVNGYIINRERIEISPRFLGMVKWIGVKKGDAVTNGQVVVLLDDAEYQARLHQAEGAVANARAA